MMLTDVPEFCRQDVKRFSPKYVFFLKKNNHIFLILYLTFAFLSHNQATHSSNTIYGNKKQQVKYLSVFFN